MERNGEMMEIKEEKTVDMLTNQSVSILLKSLLNYGVRHRLARDIDVYVNSETGRSDLQGTEPEEIVNAVFAIWGESPTVVDELEK